MSRSLALARTFLGRYITVKVDRPLGSRHPHHGYLYPVNYGYLPGVIAPDGEALDAYILGVTVPLTTFSGWVIAIIHRADDDDDKLVVVPAGLMLTDAQMMNAVAFQEQFFRSSVVRSGAEPRLNRTVRTVCFTRQRKRNGF